MAVVIGVVCVVVVFVVVVVFAVVVFVVVVIFAVVPAPLCRHPWFCCSPFPPCEQLLTAAVGGAMVVVVWIV